MSNSELDNVIRTLSSYKSSGSVEISAVFVKRAPTLKTTLGLEGEFPQKLKFPCVCTDFQEGFGLLCGQL